eukprot:4071661-Prymnesium_polylepis.2
MSTTTPRRAYVVMIRAGKRRGKGVCWGGHGAVRAQWGRAARRAHLQKVRVHLHGGCRRSRRSGGHRVPARALAAGAPMRSGGGATYQCTTVSDTFNSQRDEG